MPINKAPRKKAEFSRVSNLALEQYLKRTGYTSTDFANYIGVTPPCVARWLREGFMPKYASVILSLLSETEEIKEKQSGNVLLLTGRQSEIESLSPILERFNVTATPLEYR